MPVPFAIPKCRIGNAIEQGSNNLTINVVPDMETCRCPACDQVSQSVAATRPICQFPPCERR